MTNISLLLGAGFSVNAGYPTAAALNKKIIELKETEFCITSAGIFCILQNGDTDQWSSGDYLLAKYFLVAFKQFYFEKEKVFDYEKYFDYFYVLEHAKIKDAEFDAFADEFRKKYSSDRANNQLLHTHRLMFNQVVASFIVDGDGNKFYPPIHHGKPTFHGYTGFLNCMEEWGKDNIVNSHTLNHDLFFERLGHTDWLQNNISNGFEELGSPYYGKYQEIYMVRLSHYTGVYNTKFRLFKLHGSVDQYPFHTQHFGIVGYIKIKKGIGKTDHYKEITNENGELEYINSWINYHSDFLSGTTSKILRYSEKLYYEKQFEKFEENLSLSNKLIVIGYGCLDEEINNIIERCYGKGIEKPIYIVNPYPSEAVLEFCKKFNAKLIKKSPEEMNLTDFE
jgi:hypothetical protein